MFDRKMVSILDLTYAMPNNDVVSIRIDRHQKIAYFSLNQEDPIEIDVNSDTFYPFVRMKCVGSKVKIFDMASN